MDRLFGLNAPANLEGLSHVAVFEDPVSVAIAEELLSDAEIPFLKKERGSGTVVRLIVGFQSFGTDFFVRPEDEERAREALIPLSEPADYVFDEEPEEKGKE